MLHLEAKVNDFVEEKLSKYKPNNITAPKIIHDSILGSNIFLPHEVVVLDMPIVQRLRRISQVDLVPYVFPSGNHNRFEHTLGVTTLSGRLVDALYNRKEYDNWNGISRSSALNHVRMAALLHDCGHGPFSHMSEEYYKRFDDFIELRTSDPKFNNVKEHEIMSYLIARSPALKWFFDIYIRNQYKLDIDLELVSDIIIGNTMPYSDNAFLVDVVNGAFDADKLDYIQRDSHFTGIKMVLDVDRLFHTINARNIQDKKRLAVDMSGVNTLEQIMFNKMMLLCTVYHHHKVRAAECLVKSILNKLLELESWESASDLLYLTDTKIYSLIEHKDKAISRLAEAVASRHLPKRAFVMSRKILIDGRKTLIDLSGSLEKQMEFSEALAELCGLSNDDIWFDIKKEPKFDEANSCPVIFTRRGDNWTPLSDVFPIDAWIKTFSQNKWKAYVFTWPEYRERVFAATCKLLRKMNIGFDEEAARVECKMEDDVS